MDSTNMRELLAGFPVVTETPVAWSDMDVFRHVNNTVYFRWFEIARVAYLERVRFLGENEQGGTSAIIHSTQCRYRRPVVYPDRVHTGARTVEVGPDRFVMEYRVVSEAQRAIAAEGSAMVVSYDYLAGRKAPLPETVRRLIAEMEGSTAIRGSD
jgi:acyl-CoA thioester hydrolase